MIYLLIMFYLTLLALSINYAHIAITHYFFTILYHIQIMHGLFIYQIYIDLSSNLLLRAIYLRMIIDRYNLIMGYFYVIITI